MHTPVSPINSVQSLSEKHDRLSIKGIDQQIVEQYFSTLNAADFLATGQLFATEGVLQPPFEAPIVGPEAISAYLEQEATGFCLQPTQGTTQPLEENGCTEFYVFGRVQTPLFGVNVSWQFILSPKAEILLAKIKLLASLQELAKIRR